MTQAAADAFQERLALFAAKIIQMVGCLPKTTAGRHVSGQVLRSGTSPAPNYAEDRGAESRADFIPKLRIAVKELNETGVWLIIYSESPHDSGGAGCRLSQGEWRAYTNSQRFDQDRTGQMTNGH